MARAGRFYAGRELGKVNSGSRALSPQQPTRPVRDEYGWRRFEGEIRRKTDSTVQNEPVGNVKYTRFKKKEEWS